MSQTDSIPIAANHQNKLEQSTEQTQHWRRSWFPRTRLDDAVQFKSILEASHKALKSEVRRYGRSPCAFLRMLTVSRLYDLQCSELEASPQSQSHLVKSQKNLRAFWREDHEGEESEFSAFPTATEIPEVDRLSWVKILLDRQQFQAAREIAHLALQDFYSHKDKAYLIQDERSFITVMLFAYSSEGCTQETKDRSYVATAISILHQVRERFRKTNHNWHSETLHCLGHLYIAGFRHPHEPDQSDAINGIYFLGKAAGLNNGYYSCFTSCHAELGEHEECISVSEVALSRIRRAKDAGEPLTNLHEEDINIVEAEVIFYKAVAHLNLSQFESAELLFSEFRDMMKGKSEEAMRHASLFQEKSFLKSKRISLLSQSEIQDRRRVISGLNFTSHAFTSIQSEKEAAEGALAFIESLLRGSASWEQATTDQKLVSSLRSFLPTIALTDPMLIADLEIKVLWRDNTKRRILKDRLEASLTHALEGSLVARRSPPSVLADTARGDSLLLSINSLNALEDDTSRIVEVPIFMKNSRGIDYNRIIDATLCLISYYLALRFFQTERYVFALAPCEDSPALRYQQPDYWLCDFVEAKQLLEHSR